MNASVSTPWRVRGSWGRVSKGMDVAGAQQQRGAAPRRACGAAAACAGVQRASKGTICRACATAKRASRESKRACQAQKKRAGCSWHARVRATNTSSGGSLRAASAVAAAAARAAIRDSELTVTAPRRATVVARPREQRRSLFRGNTERGARRAADDNKAAASDRTASPELKTRDPWDRRQHAPRPPWSVLSAALRPHTARLRARADAYKLGARCLANAPTVRQRDLRSSKTARNVDAAGARRRPAARAGVLAEQRVADSRCRPALRARARGAGKTPRRVATGGHPLGRRCGAQGAGIVCARARAARGGLALGRGTEPRRPTAAEPCAVNAR